MLIVLIPIVWLTIIAIVVAACFAAARGDEALAAGTRSDSASAAPRTTWHRTPVGSGALHTTHLHGLGRTRSVRARGSRCATGS
jgi:hypothetical protein